MSTEASKSQTVDTVCNISEYVEVEAALTPGPAEVLHPTDNTSLDSGRDIIPLAEEPSSQNYNKSQTEYIKKVTETNNSVLSVAVTEVSSFYDISYCSKV